MYLEHPLPALGKGELPIETSLQPWYIPHSIPATCSQNDSSVFKNAFTAISIFCCSVFESIMWSTGSPHKPIKILAWQLQTRVPAWFLVWCYTTAITAWKTWGKTPLCRFSFGVLIKIQVSLLLPLFAEKEERLEHFHCLSRCVSYKRWAFVVGWHGRDATPAN